MEKTLEYLKKIPLFSNFSEKELKSIASLVKEREYKKGDIIVKQGDEGVGLFIIKKGKVKVSKTIASGKILDIAVHSDGEYFGELSMLDNKPRTATVTALEDTTTLIMTYWEFKALLESKPEIALYILPVLVERFRETNEQLLELKNS
ncbi:MAG: cyclic nucleotide-binding domain-containing protein [Spirochaetales bacterium]|jgi:CRP-like cAMP-binding protein|nr:cyclic nucleotide-binding domain-containing protein [Exilispira sp.]NMC66767.1 cyclic nucleotide-binding domain-containing protein [Spirochaetales bacterium]